MARELNAGCCAKGKIDAAAGRIDLCRHGPFSHGERHHRNVSRHGKRQDVGIAALSQPLIVKPDAPAGKVGR